MSESERYQEAVVAAFPSPSHEMAAYIEAGRAFGFEMANQVGRSAACDQAYDEAANNSGKAWNLLSVAEQEVCKQIAREHR